MLVTSEVLRTFGKTLKARVSCEIVTNKQLDSLFRSVSHQGVALETESIFKINLQEISHILKRETSILLLLDQLTDVQNAGNIIRSAHAFKVDSVLTTKDNAFSETPALAKAACGALDQIPVITVTNLLSTIQTLKIAGYWIAGLDSHAEQFLHDFKFPSKTALVLGAEDIGLRNLTKKGCDFLLKIKMQSKLDSINASSACAIAMYQAMIQV